MVKGQGHSKNALKSLFPAQVVIHVICHIADFNVFQNESVGLFGPSNKKIKNVEQIA